MPDDLGDLMFHNGPTGAEPTAGEAFLVVERAGSRSTLQSADIILGEAESRVAAARWVAATFARYPGCVVAGVRHRHGAWGVLSTRDDVRLVVRAGMGQLRLRSVAALAQALHGEWVARTAARP
jgi:hypothetical protein